MVTWRTDSISIPFPVIVGGRWELSTLTVDRAISLIEWNLKVFHHLAVGSMCEIAEHFRIDVRTDESHGAVAE